MNKILLKIIFLVTLVITNANALDESCYKNPMLGYFYSQKNYQIESFKEDIISLI